MIRRTPGLACSLRAPAAFLPHEHLRAAVRLKPGDAEARVNLGNRAFDARADA